MLNLERDDTRTGLALVLPLAARFYADGADMAGQRLAVFVLALAIAYGWSALFAHHTERQIGTGLIPFAMLFTVLLPGPVAWTGAAVAMSFGVVFGREIFGGKPILPPALIALAFAIFSFPEGGFETHRILSQPIDLIFALSCLPGAALLLWRRELAWRVAAGAVLGTAAASLMMNHPAWWEHLGLGTYAVGILFLASTPESAPRTKFARILLGILIGALVVVIRLANPEQPDGVIFAVLLGTLFAPLLDRLRIRRRNHG